MPYHCSFYFTYLHVLISLLWSTFSSFQKPYNYGLTLFSSICLLHWESHPISLIFCFFLCSATLSFTLSSPRLHWVFHLLCTSSLFVAFLQFPQMSLYIICLAVGEYMPAILNHTTLPKTLLCPGETVLYPLFYASRGKSGWQAHMLFF